MSSISELTIKELVALHNEHVAEDAQIKTFKGRKDELVPLVAQVMRKKRGKTIREVAEALLIEVATTNEDGHKIGHPYDYVLEQVLEEFPEANTTVKCLRWYNTKLNSDANVKMPIRPRKKTVKASDDQKKPSEQVQTAVADAIDEGTPSEPKSETPIVDALEAELMETDPTA